MMRGHRSYLLGEVDTDTQSLINRGCPQSQQGRQLNAGLGQIQLLAESKRVVDVVVYHAYVLT